MPRDGENEINAVYPLRDGELFYLSGVDENNVIHDIIFENISFKYATWNYPTQSGCYIDNQDNHVADYGKDHLRQ